MAQLNIGNQKVFYRDTGSGRPAVLLVHGAGGSARVFSELTGVLAQHCRVVALDLPGHGSSDPFETPPPPSELLEQYRDVVAELAEKLGLGRFVLVGHSMGGAMAQLFALAYPERLAGLVLVATAARLKVAAPVLQAIREQFEHFHQLIAGIGYSPASSRDQVASWARLDLQAPQQVVLADFRACATFDIRHRVAEISCSVSIISAADDRVTLPRLQQQLQQLVPRSTLVELTRAGHFMMHERPDALAEAILAARQQAMQRARPAGSPA